MKVTAISASTSQQELTDQQIRWAASVLSALWKVPKEEQVLILAIVCDAYVKSPKLERGDG